jgi:hypothetical protein
MAESGRAALVANLATRVIDDRRRLSRISARTCFPAEQGGVKRPIGLIARPALLAQRGRGPRALLSAETAQVAGYRFRQRRGLNAGDPLGDGAAAA